MSTTTSTTQCLLLFLLCLSLHACNARRLSAVDKKPENKFHVINKSTKERGSDHNVPVMSKVRSFSSKAALEVTKGESTAETQSDSINTKEAKYTEANDDLKAKSRKTKASTSASGAFDDKSSSGSVSWRVPRKKRGVQKQPGFNLDYSPPKTHPPSHN